jgi:hypothetical protein
MRVYINFDKHPDFWDAKQVVYDAEDKGKLLDPSVLVSKRVVSVDHDEDDGYLILTVEEAP